MQCLWWRCRGCYCEEQELTLFLKGVIWIEYDKVGFPGGTRGKEPAWQCRQTKRHGFDPWVGKIPWRRAWQPTLVFLPGESPWTDEPGGLWSTGSHRVRHDCSDLACTHVSPSLPIYPSLSHPLPLVHLYPFFKLEDNCFMMLCWFLP